jgi:hypothetical protein
MKFVGANVKPIKRRDGKFTRLIFPILKNDCVLCGDILICVKTNGCNLECCCFVHEVEAKMFH